MSRSLGGEERSRVHTWERSILVGGNNKRKDSEITSQYQECSGTKSCHQLWPVVALGRGGPSALLSLVLQEKPEVWIFVGDLSYFFKN